MPQRTVAILGGTGQQGRGIAQRLVRAGWPVVVGSRDPARAANTVGGWPAGSRGVTIASYGDAIAQGELILLTVPFESLGAILDEHRSRFRAESFVVDVTVPVSFAGPTATMLEIREGSAAEYVRAHVPADVPVGAAFKTVPAHLLDDLARPLDCDEFVCGDSAEVRREAAALVAAIEGLRAVDVGPLVRARSIEHLTLLAIGINRRNKIREARYRVVGL